MQQHHITAREWDALAAEPEFQALLRARRRFIVPATAFALVFYLSLPVALALAPSTMAQPIVGPLTRAFAFALLQFAMAWILLAIYMREAKSFDERAESIATRAREKFNS